jgi:hypothetical protein
MTKKHTKFTGVAVGPEFSTKALHDELQRLRKGGGRSEPQEVTLKGFLSDTWGDDMTPERFYSELGLDTNTMTIEKMLNTSDLNRYLFPEIFRDAIRAGMEYTPIYPNLITGNEPINSTGVTMPSFDYSTSYNNEAIQLRDTNEGATITEGELVVWKEKQVNIKKKARGLKQTYESIMFTPLNLAALYFQELGTRLGFDLDKDFINILLNGDQSNGSESAPVIGATVADSLTYNDIARAWIRFGNIGRNSSAMVTNEADATTILAMPQFQNTVYPGAVSPSGITLNSTKTPLPTSQDIYVSSAVPPKKIIFVDAERAVTQLTAMPLLIETDKIISRQLNGEYVSIITGFANVFKDGRLVLDYSTTLATNPGPSYLY